MKTGILSILILTFFGLTNERTVNSENFECSIKTTKKVYRIGETPEITVSITNNSSNDVYLIGSLDASEEKWRSPYCYYTIKKPTNKALPILGRCGNMNSLRKDDFKLVKSGELFNPYQSIDGYGFFSSYEIERKENFQSPGKYKITFHYSTKSTKLNDYLGDGDENTELIELFSMVPNIQLESNTIEIEIK
ncbi:hypothetical protein ATE84_0866 [Aquimarina sp. MAR_2010_214]|uniref:hypothetical protein n=1 Tax=Aquimarina sp. MAR_2010_214 TaxID=1250026 RepID=UPI000C6FF5C3|nr:hypothetical protein [Aquimarina sp. MAR_2010_214]PKV48852.1 hypothetical protein ATE84_0866 [Aquimarina sp. MAR_2010_214]